MIAFLLTDLALGTGSDQSVAFDLHKKVDGRIKVNCDHMAPT